MAYKFNASWTKCLNADNVFVTGDFMTHHREFVGDYDVRHLEQPEGSELCFATLMAGYVDGSLDIDRTNDILVAEAISQEDGATAPMMDTTLVPIENTIVTIDPVSTPFNGIEDPAEIIGLIDGAHRESSPVAMLYKKTDSPSTMDGHWITLLGFHEQDGEKHNVVLSDPLKPYPSWVEPRLLEEMVERSVASTGLYAYALSKAGVEAPAEPAEAAS